MCIVERFNNFNSLIGNGNEPVINGQKNTQSLSLSELPWAAALAQGNHC
jgi:hypothetical protein